MAITVECDEPMVICLVIWNVNGLGLSIQFGNFIIPTDELHDFSEGRYTTN